MNFEIKFNVWRFSIEFYIRLFDDISAPGSKEITNAIYLDFSYDREKKLWQIKKKNYGKSN